MPSRSAHQHSTRTSSLIKIIRYIKRPTLTFLTSCLDRPSRLLSSPPALCCPACPALPCTGSPLSGQDPGKRSARQNPNNATALPARASLRKRLHSGRNTTYLLTNHLHSSPRPGRLPLLPFALSVPTNSTPTQPHPPQPDAVGKSTVLPDAQRGCRLRGQPACASACIYLESFIPSALSHRLATSKSATLTMRSTDFHFETMPPRGGRGGGRGAKREAAAVVAQEQSDTPNPADTPTRKKRRVCSSAPCKLHVNHVR